MFNNEMVIVAMAEYPLKPTFALRAVHVLDVNGGVLPQSRNVSIPITVIGCNCGCLIGKISNQPNVILTAQCGADARVLDSNIASAVGITY